MRSTSGRQSLEAKDVQQDISCVSGMPGVTGDGGSTVSPLITSLPLSDSGRIKVFTYGTLRPSLYPYVISRFGLTPIGKGLLEDFIMYDLGAYPAITRGTGIIVGELVEVKGLGRLDLYEGYRTDGGGLYDRAKVTVNMIESDPTEAWVYFMKQASKYGHRILSGDWGNGRKAEE